MSTVVDERVVSMQFDNKQFEKNVSTSMSTLEKLKQSLQFKGATKGLEEVQAASKQLNFKEIENTACSAGFRIRDVWLKMATVFEYQVARRITNAATGMVKALTIDPIKTGLSEYETQLGAIQTILANTSSKGSTLDDVNAALDELNTYADKTIYNFTEMTKNIGTFTAAGVDLDTSVSAIKGIANLAAVSGSTSQQASTAMYQLSQALASGTVKLMDWNSVVNAGMGGEIFQNALKETARLHGVAVDSIIEKQGSFRESLSEGWLTSEILTDTLAKFTGDLTEQQLLSIGYTQEQAAEILKLGETANDAATKVKTYSQLIDTLKESAQSGWSQTWRLIIGDFEEAKTLWTKASEVFGNIINQSAEARNSLLSGALDSGWDQFLDKGIMDEEGYLSHIKKVAKKHNIAIDDMIKEEGSLEKALKKGLESGAISADVLTVSLDNMTKAYQNCSDEELKNLGYTREQVEQLAILNAKIQNGTLSIDQFAEKIGRLSGRELLFSTDETKRADGMVTYLGAIPNILKAIASVIKPIKEAYQSIFSPINSEQLYNLLESFRNFTAGLILSEDTADKLKRTFKGLFALFDIALTIIKTFGKAILSVLGHFKGLGNGILGVTAGLGDFIVGIRDAIKKSEGLENFANGFANVLIKIITIFKNFGAAISEKFNTSGFSGFLNFLKKVWDAVSTIVGNILDAIGSVGGAIFDSIDGSGLGTILDILNAGLLAGIFVKIKGLFDNVGSIVDNFNEIMSSITDTIKTFQNQVKAAILEKISKAMIMLAAAVLIISLISKDKLETALAAIALLFGVLIGAMVAFSKIPSAIVSGGSIIAISTALLILAFAFQALGDIAMGQVITSLVAIVGALGILIGALTLLSLVKSTRKMATEGAYQLLKIAIVLIPLSYVLKKLSEMYWGDIARSLVAMVGALGILVGTLTLLSLIKSTRKMATEGAGQLFKLTIMLIPLAYALKQLAKLSWDDIARSLTVLGGSLVILTGVLAIVMKIDTIAKKMEKSGSKNSITVIVGKCVQLTLIAAALGTMALTLAILSTLSWADIHKGLIAMLLSLTVLLSTLLILKKTKDLPSVGANLLAMALSVSMLASTLAFLGQLKWSTIAKGVIAMAGTMAILAGSIALMSKASSSMAMLFGDGKTGSLLGMKKETSFIKIAAALIIMAVAVKTLAYSIGLLGQMKWSTIAKGLFAIAGTMAILGASAHFLGIAAKNMILIAGAVGLLGLACLAAGAGVYLMATGLTALASSVGGAISALCEALITSAGAIGQTIAALLVSILDALVQVSDKLTNSLFQIILNAIQSLSQFAPDIIAALVDLLIGIVEKLIDFVPDLADLMAKLLNKLFEAVIQVLSQIDTKILVNGLISIGILGALIFALSKLTRMLPSAMIGAVGIVAVVTILGTLFGLLSKIPGLSDLMASGGSVLYSLGSAIGMFVGGLLSGLSNGLVSGIDSAIGIIQAIGTPENIISLGLIAGLMIAVSKLSGSIGNTASSGIKLAIIIGELAIIFAAIGKLSSMSNMVSELQNGIDIITLMGSTEVITSLGLIAGLMFVLSKISGSVSNTALSGAKLAIIIGEIGLIIGALGGIALIPGVFEAITKGTEILKLIGSPAVILSLGLMTALMIALSFASPFTGQAIIGALGLGGVIAALGLVFAAVGALSGVINNGLSVFQMIASPKNILMMGLMTALMVALGLAAPLSVAALAGVLGMGLVVGELSLVLAALGGLYRIPGITEFIADGGNFLQTIGTAIGQFFGGILGGIAVGVTASLPTMGQHFADFMTNLQPFLQGIASVDSSVIESAKSLASALLTITATDLLNNLIRFLGGDIPLDTLGTQLGAFGSGIMEFANEVKDINEDTLAKVETAAKAGVTLADMAKKLPRDGGVWQALAGAKDIEDFGGKLGAFGKGIASFATEVSKITTDSGVIETYANAGLTLVKVADQMPTKGGIFKADLDDLKTRLGKFAVAMVKFVTDTSGVTVEDINAVKSKITTLNDTLKSFSADSVKSITDNFADSKTKISGAIKAALQSAIDSISSFGNKVKDAGKKFVDNLVVGIENQKNKVKKAMQDTANNASTSIHSQTYYDKYHKVGAYLAQGFADGITDTTYAAETAATAMANAAKTAAEEALNEHSPSKVFYQIGEYAGIGFVNAFKDYEVVSGKAGTSMAESAVNGLRNAITKAKYLIENGIDSQPTIRPVLDLSNVAAGANAINGMLGMSPSVGVLSKVNSISSAMNRNQNGVDNSDIITAIKDLKNTLEDNTGDSYYFGDVKVDNGSEVEAAFATIARAAKMSGRR